MSRATPVARGCGSRTAGGTYLECGLGGTTPIEAFLFDPPLFDVPLDWLEPHRNPVLVERDGLWHAVIWVGAESYPSMWDFIEEVRVAGASRRVPTTFNFEKITPGSRMFFVHGRADVTMTVEPPTIRQGPIIYDADAPPVVAGTHDREGFTPAERRHQRRRYAEATFAITVEPHCPMPVDRFGGLSVPVHTARILTTAGESGQHCLGFAKYRRETVPTTYQETLEAEAGGPTRLMRTLPCGHAYEVYEQPAGSHEAGIPPPTVRFEAAPAVFMALPISGVAMVQKPDGTFDPKVRDRVAQAGVEVYAVDA